jgi:cell division protein ZapA
MTNSLTETMVEILDKNYRIKCPDTEVDSLQQAARFLEDKMRQIRDSGVAQLDKIAVMAALNIAYQLLNFESLKQNELLELNQRLYDLHNRIDDTLLSKTEDTFYSLHSEFTDTIESE